MNRKIRIGLIGLAITIILGTILMLFNIYPYYFCTREEMMHQIPTNYCKNVNGNLKYKDCIDTRENKDNIIGVSKHLICENFDKTTYYLNHKKVLKNKFFSKINEINQSCNGCVMIVKPAIE